MQQIFVAVNTSNNRAGVDLLGHKGVEALAVKLKRVVLVDTVMDTPERVGYCR